MTDVFTPKTFRQLTAPGYVDFSAQQTAATAKITDWINRVMRAEADQVNLFDRTFRQWMVRDYTGITPSQNLYLYYLSKQYGLPFIQTDLNVQRDLLEYVVSPRPGSFAECINQLLTLLYDVGWITNAGSVVRGSASPVNYSETLIMYSAQAAAPARPDVPYARWSWSVPSGWTKFPASSKWVSRGYLYGGNIVWLPPVSTVTPPAYYNVELLADLPVSANDGDVAGVFDDGSGDMSAVYTYSAGVWYKCSTLYNLQGQVGVDSPLNSGGVWAPDGDVTSEDQPPVLGPSHGYGFYGIYGQTSVSRNLQIILTLTDAGQTNLGIVQQLFRKIKPAVTVVLFLYTTYNGELSIFQIKDSEAIY